MAIDLYPLSRTAHTAHITIVDELTRCLPLITDAIRDGVDVNDFDNEKNLKEVLRFISDYLNG